MLDIQDDISSYLAFSHYIDWNEPSVQRKAKELKTPLKAKSNWQKPPTILLEMKSSIHGMSKTKESRQQPQTH
ncbi:hypothetical protein BBM1114_00815 [Bifidobacterium breve MCC 1114]|uniref:Uncharacterized protein n=1 Tax=Bifidobacterium breve MCC 1114 TaxID=1365964 RepID=A0A0L7D439_BIFBR|nr:hypothetical protein BBM1114_00815 [Bifidobacterium breve MCC 1114]